MLEVTKAATDKIAEYFQDKDISPVRIFLLEGGCGLPSLALDLDEIKDTDAVFEIDGFQFIVDEDLLKEAVPIKVDYNRMSGFQFDCALEFEEECSDCHSCCLGC